MGRRSDRTGCVVRTGVGRVMQPEVLWQPSPDIRRRARIGRYLDLLETRHGLRFATYADLWRWSVADLDSFWRTVWEFSDIEPAPPDGPAAVGAMPEAHWFPDASVNYARQMLRPTLDGVAIVARSQTREPVELTFAELREQVARAATGLRRLGVQRGDRVAAYLPNTPEALVAMLATAALGAVWSSCAPEFGVRAVVDRFGQIEPKVLLVVDGYRYGDRVIPRDSEVAALRSASAFGRDVGRAAVPRRGRVASRRGDRLGRARLRTRSTRLRTRAVRASALRAVLVGHDRAAQGDRARPRRHPPRARQVPRAPSRHRSERPVLLVHDHRAG